MKKVLHGYGSPMHADEFPETYRTMRLPANQDNSTQCLSLATLTTDRQIFYRREMVSTKFNTYMHYGLLSTIVP